MFLLCFQFPPTCSYVVPLVFFHFCRKWTTTRDDICTNDNRSIVPLGACCMPSAAVTAVLLLPHRCMLCPHFWHRGAGCVAACCMFILRFQVCRLLLVGQ